MLNKNILADSKTSPKLYEDTFSPQFKKAEQFSHVASTNFTGHKEKTKTQSQLNSFELVQKKLFRQQKDKAKNKLAVSLSNHSKTGGWPTQRLRSELPEAQTCQDERNSEVELNE